MHSALLNSSISERVGSKLSCSVDPCGHHPQLQLYNGQRGPLTPTTCSLIPSNCINDAPSFHAAVRTCNECFLEHVAWDASRTYDVYGAAGDKPVVLVHGALVGRHCLSLEAQALSEVGFRCVTSRQQHATN